MEIKSIVGPVSKSNKSKIKRRSELIVKLIIVENYCGFGTGKGT
jgi:hypothetical protein